MSRQKELDADLEAIQQVELVGKLGMVYMLMAHMFVLTIFKKTKQKRLKFSQGKVTVLQITKITNQS